MSQLESLFEDLSSPENQTRRDADSRLENAFANDADAVITEIITLAKDGQSRQVRLQAYPIFRRLAFRPVQSNQIVPDPSTVAWDSLKNSTQDYVQSTLLNILPLCVTERNEQERNALVFTIAQVEVISEERGHPWDDLNEFLTSAANSEAPYALRDAAFKIHAECPAILQDREVNSALETLMLGLKDQESPGVQLSALKATSAYINLGPLVDSNSSGTQALLVAVMEVVFSISKSGSEPRLAEALKDLIELFNSRTAVKLLLPSLSEFATFLASLITNQSYGTDIHHLCIEILATLAEQGGSEIFNDQYSSVWSKCAELFLSLMSTVPVDPKWEYNESIKSTDDEDHTSSVAEQALDRIALCYPPAIIPTAFTLIPAMIKSQTWKERYAGLAALGTLAEACTNEAPQLGNILQYLRPAFKDEEVRVQYSAIYAMSQLASFFGGQLQRNFAPECLSDLTTSLNSPQPRIQAYAASAMVNFLEDVDNDCLVPYIETILNALLSVLGNSKMFVQNKVLSALASLASASGQHFNSHYGKIMPLLLQVLERNEPSYDENLMSLQGRAMECAGRVAAAVDPSIFEPDAVRVIQDIFKIQSTITDDDDEIQHHCMQALACTAKGMGQEMFQPYLDRVTSELLRIASHELELTRWDDGADEIDDSNEVLFSHNGEICKVNTDQISTKTVAVETLVVVSAVSGKYFVPYIQNSLEVIMPALTMDFAEQLRDSAVTFIITLVEAAIDASSSEQDMYRLLNEVIAKNLFQALAAESYPAFVSKLATGASRVLELVPGVLEKENQETLLKAIETQLYEANLRYQSRSEHAEDTTDSERQLAQELDNNALIALSTLIRYAYKWQSKSYPSNILLNWFENYMASEDPAQKLWAFRLLIDSIEILGSQCPQEMSAHINTIVTGLQAQDANVRQTSAYGIGICAEFGEHAFDNTILMSVEALLNACIKDPGDDEIEMMAKDNALASLAKILKYNESMVDVESILPRFLDGLPILLDEAEMPVTYEVLLRLIERNHPLVSVEDPKNASKVISWLKHPIEQNANIPDDLLSSIESTLSMYTQKISSV